MILADLSGLLRGIIGDVPRAILGQLNKALDEKAGDSGAKVAGRAVCEAIDDAMETPFGDVEQRAALGFLLAENAAKACELEAAAIRAYAPLQAEVVRAKATGDSQRIAAARAARNAGAVAVKTASQAVPAAAAGDARL